MNELGIDDRVRILNCLIEGMSVRATSRITGAAKGTILKLVRTVGPACREFMDRYFVDLPCEHIEMDEVWAFVGFKEGRAGERESTGTDGSVWTWVATCSECKLIADYAIGTRTASTARPFLKRLARRFNDRLQVTSDGFTVYYSALLDAFESESIDYVKEIKKYGDSGSSPERKYSPAQISGWKKEAMIGHPDMDRATTSHAERTFLTLRMENRRFTRLTNAHSKKIEYHTAMFSIWAFYYNLIRKHSTLRGKTPAMAAEITEHALTLRDMLFAVDQVTTAA